MDYISATDAKRELGTLLAKARRGPITVRKQNRDAAVILSPEDYRRLIRLNIEEFQDFRARVGRDAAARGLTAEQLDALLSEPA